MTETLHSDDSWNDLLDQVSDAWTPSRWRDLGVVVGCSGGADSVGLMTALCQLRRPGDQWRRPSSQMRQHGGRSRQQPVSDATAPPRGFLVLAHFNHGLRGRESDDDEAFVRDLAEQCGTPVVIGRAQSQQRDEATMRSERLRFLTETAHAAGARYIALAHSADDNVETVLHHLLRGTGPAGLAGIAITRDIDEDLVLVRPLLHVGRTRIRDGLRALGQPWREDSSNDDTQYRRNWIRHRLLPLIQSEYPGAVDAIGRAIESQREWRTLIDRLALDWLETHRRSDSPLTFGRDSGTERSIVIAAAQRAWNDLGWSRGEMTREHWIRLATTIGAHCDQRYTLPGNIDVTAQGDDVRLNRRGSGR